MALVVGETGVLITLRFKYAIDRLEHIRDKYIILFFLTIIRLQNSVQFTHYSRKLAHYYFLFIGIFIC